MNLFTSDEFSFRVEGNKTVCTYKTWVVARYLHKLDLDAGGWEFADEICTLTNWRVGE